MATAKKTTKKKITATDIISKYMDHVLEHGEVPVTIYKFCKDIKCTEAEFYEHFGSFEGLKQHIWIALYDSTVATLHKDKDFEQYPNKDKMLSFLYTIFGNFTANRSYILFVLKEHAMPLKNLAQLKELRTKVRHFATELIEEGNEDKTYKITKNPVQLFSEGAWVQFLLLLKYWMNDNSAGFEKTDVAIEKSVKAIFDVFETTPLESIIDLGKFLVKENFAFAKSNS
ncbi:TetR family transcriptional regulator C-terminal domain-containing protein [uncultured Dokdonia sp.]|uniref:TetR/AcrR family transcriptional regulator n=1 Tax=uncultured Dokdonia sp. TaxID=575653 RepID=UPI0026335A13|nr:TetR family transcriptional regulator C-terminal domain-containing protein [uncultured Dokdonia sp.]